MAKLPGSFRIYTPPHIPNIWRYKHLRTLPERLTWHPSLVSDLLLPLSFAALALGTRTKAKEKRTAFIPPGAIAVAAAGRESGQHVARVLVPPGPRENFFGGQPRIWAGLLAPGQSISNSEILPPTKTC